jgi:hypothetical protein
LRPLNRGFSTHQNHNRLEPPLFCCRVVFVWWRSVSATIFAIYPAPSVACVALPPSSCQAKHPGFPQSRLRQQIIRALMEHRRLQDKKGRLCFG